MFSLPLPSYDAALNSASFAALSSAIFLFRPVLKEEAQVPERHIEPNFPSLPGSLTGGDLAKFAPGEWEGPIRPEAPEARSTEYTCTRAPELD